MRHMSLCNSVICIFNLIATPTSEEVNTVVDATSGRQTSISRDCSLASSPHRDEADNINPALLKVAVALQPENVVQPSSVLLPNGNGTAIPFLCAFSKQEP